jgi:starch synthase
MAAYRDPGRWQALMRRAMARDFSWAASAPRYVDAYRRALEIRRTAPGGETARF